MKRLLLLFFVLVFLAGCASRPAPEWIGASYNHLESFKRHYLRGDEILAEKSFQRALEEIRTSGDIDAMAKGCLVRFAVRTAVLEAFDDREYLRLSTLRSSLPHLDYYSFLKGSFAEVAADRLPVQYRPFLKALLKGDPGDIEREAIRIEDPLSRLIAAGLIVRDRQASEQLLNGAIETASQQGWKKPLLAYLKKLERYYDSVKETSKAAEVRKRLEWIGQ